MSVLYSCAWGKEGREVKCEVGVLGEWGIGDWETRKPGKSGNRGVGNRGVGNQETWEIRKPGIGGAFQFWGNSYPVALAE